MQKLAFLGNADALKPLIILSEFSDNMQENEYQISFITEQENGKCVEFCRSQNYSVYVLELPTFSNKDVRFLENQQFDILISVGWDRLIPRGVLNIFPNRAINCHGSFLPDYRGSRAYVHYWANCEEYYGATVHLINEKFDDGYILAQSKLKLYESENLEMIHRRTAELLSLLLPIALYRLKQGYLGKAQIGRARYFYKISSDDASSFRRENLCLKSQQKELKLTPHKEIILSTSVVNEEIQ